MRNAFIKTFSELAAKDKDMMLLTGDLGFTVFEDFMKQYPEQFVNCGVAEQNMIGMAAGLALSGKKVFVYSIIPFLTMRAFEQVRDDVCIHNLNVKLVGVGGGYSYGFLGPTHHSLEDIALMKVLPNMKVVVPADPAETEAVVRALAADTGPAYLRLGKSKEANLHDAGLNLDWGKASVLKDGGGLTIIGAGPILSNVLQAAKILQAEGIDCRVVSMNVVKPLDEAEVFAAAKKGKIVTAEEHNVIGGLGDSVAALIATGIDRCQLLKLGVEDRFMTIAGDQDHLRGKNGLSAEGIADRIRKFVK